MGVTSATAVLDVREVSRRYGGAPRPALTSTSFAVAAGRTLAVVGESGAGKSTLVRIVTGLEPPDAGEVLLNGERQAVRPGHVSPIQMVFQDPRGALSPLTSVGASVAEPLRGRRGMRRARVAELLTAVGIDPARARDRPRTFSGGQLQRIVLARALAAEPTVLVCDEPTSALDVSVQAQIVNLLLDLQRRYCFACVVVTHDLGVVRVLADDVIVLEHGCVVEASSAEAFFAGPAHPYARGLLDAERELQAVDRPAS